jgi:hypothetical protein
MLRLVAASFVSVLLLAGCRGGEPTPEERVVAVLAELERAAEARDVGLIEPHVSESYKDENGNDRRALLGLATAHFMRNKSVYLLVRVSDVALPEPGRAQVDAFVALAGQPIRDLAALPELHADLYRFGFALRDEDGEWRVTAADWHPATLADFE